VDRHKRWIGTSLFVVLLGALLLCVTYGGVFNPVIPWPQGAVGLPVVYHPEGAHIDLTRSGPRAWPSSGGGANGAGETPARGAAGAPAPGSTRSQTGCR